MLRRCSECVVTVFLDNFAIHLNTGIHFGCCEIVVAFGFDPDGLALTMDLITIPVVGLVGRFDDSFSCFSVCVLVGIGARHMAR